MALTTVKSDQIQTSVALAGSPTTTTQSASDNSTKIATTAYVETAVANLVDSAPASLNTLDELAAALNDDASFSTTITNSIATKLPLAGGTLTGALVGTTATFAGGAANNNDDANILTLNASQHARLLVDTSSTGGHRATLALESNGNELTLSNTGSASYLASVGNLEISGGNVTVKSGNKLIINRADDATGGEITYGPSSGTGFIFNDVNGDGIDFKTGSTMLMSIDSTAQRVGIGTGANIDQILHVEKSSGTTLVKTEVASGSIVGFEIAKTGSTTQSWRIVDGATVNGTLEIYDVTDSRQVMAFKGDGKVGIGESSPLGHVHIKTADSGASVDVSADELVVESNGNAGISILSGQSNAGSIYFGDAGVNWDGYIAYSQAARKFTFGVAAGGNSLEIDSNETLIGGSATMNGKAGTSPLLEMINNDNEDNDTGRETTLRFSGHRSGGEDAINAQISGHHQGNADDDRGQLKFWTNTGSGGLTEKVQIESGGDLRVKAGSIVVETSGHGIYIGGGAGANRLDDYEEGTWTPTLIAGTTNPTGGGALAPSGTYTKIGNRVWLTFYVGRSWTNSPSGTVYVGNLPFTVHSTSPNYYSATATTYNVNFGTANIPFWIPTGGSNSAALYTASNSGTWSALTWQSHMSSSSGSYVSGMIHFVVA